MGASNSKVEEDKALQMCQERKKFVKQALNGRCQLADTHVNYIELLKITGTALRKFVELEGPIESSLYTPTSAMPGPLVLNEKSISQFSYSTPSMSQRMDATENFSPSSSPPTSGRYQVNHMKFGGSLWRKVEEKPSVRIIESVTSLSSPQNTTPRSTERPEMSPFQAPPIPPGTPPWDYFGISHPNDSQFSSQEGWGINHSLGNDDEIRRFREEEGIPELVDENDKDSSSKREESQESEDEFDDPSTDTLVRSFKNVNRDSNDVAASGAPAMPSSESVASETEIGDGKKDNSPDLSPLRAASPGVATPNHIKTTPVREDGFDSKVAPKDLFSSMKDIEYLFLKASESGREVPRMLEANKFHFRPIFAGKERESTTAALFTTCFSCGEDPSQVQEEPAQTAMKYITWHRTTSSHSSSSRIPVGSKDEMEDITINLFDNSCMVSGSHASTLDRLYAWERKLYDEVKASKRVRKDYDSACKLLRQLESKGESSVNIDKTRAVVKDLHSRIGVAIHRIDSISKKIEELRDKELQPQLEELIEGFGRMWEEMLECHKLQFNIISIAISNCNSKLSFQSESRHQIALHLEHELSSLSTNFTKWVGAQKSYVQAINGWLFKCVSFPQKSSKRKRRVPPPPLRNFGPPIYVTCGVWLDMLNVSPTKEVADSIKGLVTEIAHFLPRQEKHQGKGWRHAGNHSDSTRNLVKDEASEDCITGFDGFKSSLVGFLGQLNNIAEYSANMYREVQKATTKAKSSYEQKSQS